MGKESLYKEIDLIQGCINRMAQNSFMLKGWALTVFAGVTAFMRGENLENNLILLCTVIIPFFCFWLLDAFFLRTERIYCSMYSDVLEKRRQGDFSGQFELKPKNESAESLVKIMFSFTLRIFYGIPLLICLLLFCYNLCKVYA